MLNHLRVYSHAEARVVYKYVNKHKEVNSSLPCFCKFKIYSISAKKRRMKVQCKNTQVQLQFNQDLSFLFNLTELKD